jgi:thioredoxin-related protein
LQQKIQLIVILQQNSSELMKFTFNTIAFSFLFSLAVQSQPSPLSAEEILKEAYQTADKEKKKVFIMFHASWCGWCHKMDKSMNDEACKKFFDDNFVIRHLVVNESIDKKNLVNPGAEELIKKYHGEEQGIPFWLVFDKQGKLLADSKIRVEGAGPETGENTGCPATEREVEYFIAVLQKTTNLNLVQLDIIRKRFRQNEQ